MKKVTGTDNKKTTKQITTEITERCDITDNKGDFASDYSAVSDTIGGIYKMNIMTTKLFENEVVGVKALRTNLTTYISKAINNFQEVLAGNTSVKGGKTVSIIPTELFEEVLANYKFKTIVNKDTKTGFYEIIVDEIGAAADGDTYEEALEILIDNIVMLTEDYFEKLEFYKGIANMRKRLPYYLRVKHCKEVAELMKVLGLDEKKF